MGNEQAGRHLTVEQVARYVDRTALPDERAGVVAHLADCAECRREVVEVRRTLNHSSAAARWWKLAVPAAAAAAVLFLLGRSPERRPGDAGGEYRDPTTADSSAPLPRAPIGSASLPVDLVWSSVAGAGEYRVTVFDSEGTIVFRAPTGDTALTLPDTARLQVGATYFWRVEVGPGSGSGGRRPPARFTVVERSRR